MIYKVTPVGYQTRVNHRWYEDVYTHVGLSKREQQRNKSRMYRFDALWRMGKTLEEKLFFVSQ